MMQKVATIFLTIFLLFGITFKTSAQDLRNFFIWTRIVVHADFVGLNTVTIIVDENWWDKKLIDEHTPYAFQAWLGGWTICTDYWYQKILKEEPGLYFKIILKDKSEIVGTGWVPQKGCTAFLTNMLNSIANSLTE